MTCGKGIGGGFPLAAVVSTDALTARPSLRESVRQLLLLRRQSAGVGRGPGGPRDHRQRESRRERASASARRCSRGSRRMQEKHRIIGDVRGKGLLLGLELVTDRRTKELVSKEFTKALFQECLRRGLVAMVYTRSSASTRR